jgi:leucyl/phenylalanyl-tRNA--protein transferase
MEIACTFKPKADEQMGSHSEEESWLIPPLDPYSHAFPDPREASDEGVLAWGGDLSPARLLQAYRQGIFPWFNASDPILWWSPNPRMVLYPERFRISRSFRRVLRNATYTVRFDHDFAAVIRACGQIPRPGQQGTWLHPQMQEAYEALHRQGFAHSVETYMDGVLVGGLYGLALGRAFFGESMFAYRSNASKIALAALRGVLAAKSYDFIDCQVETDHLKRMGAVTIPREQFLTELDEALQWPDAIGSWADYRWEYNDADR